MGAGLNPPERVDEFFGFLKVRIGAARKYGPAARDFALFRTLYHAGPGRRSRRCWRPAGTMMAV